MEEALPDKGALENIEEALFPMQLADSEGNIEEATDPARAFQSSSETVGLIS